MTRNVRLTLVQMRDAGSANSCCDAAVRWIEQAVEQGAEIICLQELFTGPYPCQAEDHRMFDLAESIPGPTIDRLADLARRHEVVIVAPVFECRAPGLYHNTAVVLDADGTVAGMYRKMHVPDDPLFYEKFYFTPGDLGFRSARTQHGHIGTLICWDQWYPEAARLTALQGAEVLFYPTAIGWLPPEKAQYGETQLQAWMGAMKGHAVCNGVYVAAANRIGLEPNPSGEGGIEFWGHSFIAGPQGEILAQASADQEKILMAELNREHLETVRQNWPFYRDRRIDAYEAITERSLLP